MAGPGLKNQECHSRRVRTVLIIVGGAASRAPPGVRAGVVEADEERAARHSRARFSRGNAEGGAARRVEGLGAISAPGAEQKSCPCSSELLTLSRRAAPATG